MYVMSFLHPCHHLGYLSKIHFPVDLPDRIRIRRLHTDLQLDHSRTHRANQCDLFLI